MKRVAILGSTGSVGTQALDVVRSHRADYEVVALAAGRNAELLDAQAAEFGVDPKWARSLRRDDPDALAELAAHPEADVVLNAVVGFAGLARDDRRAASTASASRWPTRRASSPGARW